MDFPHAEQTFKKIYLFGTGIEIGALHLPLFIPSGATVRYVDRAPIEELRKKYPELKNYDLVPVDIIDNGETLNSVAPASQDFIIANHFLEHCENPIGTITTHLSKLKPGGILYVAIPDKTKTFDKQRQVTTLEHVIKDFSEGTEGSRLEHYLECARFIEHLPEDKIEARARELMQSGYSIHFHVWRKTDFHRLLQYVRVNLEPTFIIRETASSRNEFIFIFSGNNEHKNTRTYLKIV